MFLDKTAHGGRHRCLTVLLFGCTALAPAGLLAQQAGDTVTVLAPITLDGQGDDDARRRGLFQHGGQRPGDADPGYSGIRVGRDRE
ncbi:hypothetical protein [Paracoccus sediminis]|uniref:hypothetical protein n=1 Tax=Paracoccus sediminis TaxID=1214787 RepID=UPI001A9384D9|nr:hypothetical protein [Paracoccus sediminis]